MKTVMFGLIAALGLCAASYAAAAPGIAGQQMVVEGRVGSFLEPGLFWLNGKDGSKTLIYTNGEATKNLSLGQNIRVTGSKPMDWAQLAATELAANSIEAVN